MSAAGPEAGGWNRDDLDFDEDGRLIIKNSSLAEALLTRMEQQRKAIGVGLAGFVFGSAVRRGLRASLNGRTERAMLHAARRKAGAEDPIVVGEGDRGVPLTNGNCSCPGHWPRPEWRALVVAPLLRGPADAGVRR